MLETSIIHVNLDQLSVIEKPASQKAGFLVHRSFTLQKKNYKVIINFNHANYS